MEGKKEERMEGSEGGREGSAHTHTLPWVCTMREMRLIDLKITVTFSSLAPFCPRNLRLIVASSVKMKTNHHAARNYI